MKAVPGGKRLARFFVVVVFAEGNLGLIESVSEIKVLFRFIFYFEYFELDSSKEISQTVGLEMESFLFLVLFSPLKICLICDHFGEIV